MIQGKHVTLWAYARGEAARDLPYTLWRMIEDVGDWKRIMWVDTMEPSRVSMFGDLVYWINFMHSITDPKIFVLISDNETGSIAGFIWFNRIQKDSAYGSIWIHPWWRGRRHTREAGKLGLQYAHELLKLKTVYTITPYADVRNFDKRIGFREVAFLPKIAGPDVWLLEHTNG